MKTNHLWPSIFLTPSVLAQGLRQATGGPEATTTIDRYPTPTPEISNCTASLITTLCDYKEPGSAFAVASSGKAHCWEYCNAHQPCNFVIFARGNPYTGSGTCWLYPDEEFDQSLGTPGCDYLSVFDKPQCAGEPTRTDDDAACTATASPSAVATVCDYPTPDDDCWSSCTASTGATNCLSQCADAEACSYVVFNPHNDDNSPFASGTCWMYQNGTYDASKAGSCSEAPEQYVYENPCPKVEPAASASASAAGKADASPSATPSGTVEVSAERASEGAAAPSTSANGAVAEGGSAAGSLFVGVAALVWQRLL